MGLTRWRDLVLIGGIATVVAYFLIRLNYGNVPTLPRLAGVTAAVVGVGEALIGFNIKARIEQYSSRSVGRSTADSRLKPIPPLVAARAVMVAKATALAGAGVVGLWLGVLIYVAPQAGSLEAAGEDTSTSIIGLVGALIMVGGALWLERCCVRPEDDDRGSRRDRGDRGEYGDHGTGKN